METKARCCWAVNRKSLYKYLDGIGRLWFIYLSIISFILTAGVNNTWAVHNLELQLDGNTEDDALAPAFDWENFFDASGDPIPPLPVGFVESIFITDHVNDPNDLIFASSKDTDPVEDWSCTTSKPPTKDDLQNVYALTYVSGPDAILYFGAERLGNNGDANIGIWFLQDDSIDCDPAVNSGNFTGHHVDGDLFLVAAFTNGGEVASIDVYKWEGDDSGGINETPFLSGADCADAVLGDDICAVVNNILITTPWSGDLDTVKFFEGGANIAAIFPGGGDKEFSKFLVDTRTSAQLNSTVKDYALAGLKLRQCNEDTDCDDDNPCTVDDCGQSGFCENTPGNEGEVCRESENVCDPAEECDGESSVCPEDVTTSEDCCLDVDDCPEDDGNKCNGVPTCIDNQCGTSDDVTCDPASDVCHTAGTCEPTTGICSEETEIPNCCLTVGDCSADDGNKCNGVPTCIDNQCGTSDDVTCDPASDVCHTAGTCEPTTGICSDETSILNCCITVADCPADDGNMCNGVPTCEDNVCGTSTPVTCDPASDVCHTAGTCNPGTGVCSPETEIPNCCLTVDDCPDDDGNMCNGVPTCEDNVCGTSTPVACDPASDECHAPGACNPGTGVCSPETEIPDCCISDEDCTDTDGNECTVPECSENSCNQDQLAEGATCASDEDCSAGNVCVGCDCCPDANEDGECDECDDNEDCPDDGDVCNGPELCINGSCGQGEAPTCGDDEVDGSCGEECDDGEDNSDSDPDACRTDCTQASCGDNVTDTGEQCDGTDNSACGESACSANCQCVPGGQEEPCPDQDNDGVCDDVDNCPGDFNPDQLDEDGDGVGAVCDGDDSGIAGTQGFQLRGNTPFSNALGCGSSNSSVEIPVSAAMTGPSLITLGVVGIGMLRRYVSKRQKRK